MTLGDFLARLGGRGEESRPPEPEPEPELHRPPSADALRAALGETERLVDEGAVPSPVTARVRRVTATVRDTIPRLDALGAGSDQAYAVMATATDYLPEAVGGYLRLPRRFADTRPVDGPKTALMVLVDQLDLLGATMDAVFDAVCRDDANALVAHGRFLAEKFGTRSRGGDLEVQGIPVPPPEPPPASGAPPGAASALAAASAPASGAPPAAASAPAPASAPEAPAESAGSQPRATGSPQPTVPSSEPVPQPSPEPAAPQVDPLRPPSSLDL